MKKVLLVTASLIALGAAAPAVAADLAARPYTKAPPMIAAVYDWSGFYIGANGGWGSSHNAGILAVVVAPKVATMRPAARSVARSVIAGRPVPGCSAWKRRATGPTSTAAMSAWCSRPSATTPKIDAFGLFTGQVGYAANNVLLYVKGGAAVTSNSTLITLPPARSWPHRRRHPLGRHGRRRPRIRLRSELVGRRRIRSPVHAGPHLHLHQAGGRVLQTDRISQDVDLVTARINYKFGGPVVGQLLIFAQLATAINNESPGHRPGLFSLDAG